MAALVLGFFVLPTVLTAGIFGYVYGMNAALLSAVVSLFFMLIYPWILGSLAYRSYSDIMRSRKQLFESGKTGDCYQYPRDSIEKGRNDIYH